MILVTGGSGLVGKELIRQLLSQGKQVTAIYNNTPLADINDPLLAKQQCNILDTSRLEEIMQGIEQVYHCAAIVTFNPRRKDELYKINVEGTANVVNAALEAGVKKLVYVSSTAVFGKSAGNEMVSEKIKWSETKKYSNYAKSKYLAEMEAWRGFAEGLKTVIVNPSIILGQGNWNEGSSKIFKTVYNEFPWYSDGVNGFVDVRDVASIMIRLMESDISGERFLLSAENKSYADVFNLIAKGFDKKPPYKKVSPSLSQIIWRLEALKNYFSGKEPLVTKETAATALRKTYFDNSKLKNFLPDFEYKLIDQTIAETCLAYKQGISGH